MAKFESHQELLAELNTLSGALESGKLTAEELERFKEITKNLYERAIVLQYKAIEKKVFGEQPKENEPSKVAEPKKEVKTPKPQEPEIMFDFTGTEEEPVTEEKIVPPKEEEITTVTTEVVEEKPKEEETTITTTKTTEIRTEDDTVYSFYERFTQVHKESLMDVLGSQKLASLKGAFGLNDKLQIISELFHGNSDAFEKAVEQLDNQESDEKARLKLSEIAAHHQWEPDHRLVEDFAKVVERRYIH